MSEDVFPELVPTLRRRTVRWFSILLGTAFLLALTLSLVGAVYQMMSARRDREAFPPPGQLVDVGGYRLHAQVSGEGAPTVILEAGLGSSTVDWSLAAPAIAEETRVFRYDRAGLGWSDSPSSPSTPETMIRDLENLLDAMEIGGPYVLVGHSMGGYLARLFQARHPESVRGMVLVDAAHERLFESLPVESRRRMDRKRRIARALGVASHLGATRIGLRFFGDRFIESDSALGSHEAAARRSFFATSKFMRAAANEFRILGEMARQVDAARGDAWTIPLAVVTPGAHDGFPDWPGQQRDLAALSTDSVYVLAEGSGHYVQIDRPDLVVEAVLNIVEKIREADANRASAPRVLRVNRIWGEARGQGAP